MHLSDMSHDICTKHNPPQPVSHSTLPAAEHTHTHTHTPTRTAHSHQVYGTQIILPLYLCFCVYESVSICVNMFLCIYLCIMCLSMYVYLSACLSFCLPVCLSACLSVCLSACLSVCLSVPIALHQLQDCLNTAFSSVAG